MKLFSLVLFLVPSLVFAQEADDILGYWLTQDADAKIEVYKKGGAYFGKVVWLEEPLNDQGEPMKDINNPDEARRNDPMMGMNLVSDFRFNDDQWEDGEIYDPNDGKVYSCRMRLKKDKLEVRGYVGMPMFGRTVVWTRTSL